MSLEPMPLFWLVLTLAAYLGSRWLYRRSGRYVLSPLILVPALLLAVAVPLHTAYAEYARDTHWLMGVLGPVTVAFAVPIWQQRMMLARHWPALLVGMLAGSMASIASSWGLAHLLALDNAVSLSLLPRSITTPFAMPLAQDLGGVPELTAVFVMFTGVLGAMFGACCCACCPCVRLWPVARCLALVRMAPGSVGRMKWAVRKARWPAWSWCSPACSICSPAPCWHGCCDRSCP